MRSGRVEEGEKEQTKKIIERLLAHCNSCSSIKKEHIWVKNFGFILNTSLSELPILYKCICFINPLLESPFDNLKGQIGNALSTFHIDPIP
jgi:hypothetical protein